MPNDPSAQGELRKRHVSPPAVQDQPGSAQDEPVVAIHDLRRSEDSKAFILVVLISLSVSLSILYYYGLFASGKWPSAGPVSLISSESQGLRLLTSVRESSGGEIAKPFVLVFFSESCISCRKMTTHVIAAAERLEVDNVSFFAVPVGKGRNKELVGEFDIQYVPAVYLVTSAGLDGRFLYSDGPSSQKLFAFIKSKLDVEA